MPQLLKSFTFMILYTALSVQLLFACVSFILQLIVWNPSRDFELFTFFIELWEFIFADAALFTSMLRLLDSAQVLNFSRGLLRVLLVSFWCYLCCLCSGQIIVGLIWGYDSDSYSLFFAATRCINALFFGAAMLLFNIAWYSDRKQCLCTQDWNYTMYCIAITISQTIQIVNRLLGKHIDNWIYVHPFLYPIIVIIMTFFIDVFPGYIILVDIGSACSLLTSSYNPNTSINPENTRSLTCPCVSLPLLIVV